jgi:hypothetical protein
MYGLSIICKFYLFLNDILSQLEVKLGRKLLKRIVCTDFLTLFRDIV